MKKISTVLITLIILLSHANAQDFSSFSPGKYALTPFSENGLWGYKNESGVIVIKPKFELAAPFYLRESSYTPQKEYLSTKASIKKLTVAKYENKWVLINENGKIKEKLDADEVSLKYNRYSWIYRKNDKYGIISYNGKILSKPIYDFIIPTNKTDSKYGLNQHENISDFIYQQNGKVGVSRILTLKDEIFEIIPANYYKFYDYNMNSIDFNFKGNSCVLWGDVSGDISLDETFRKKSDEYIYRHGYEDPIKVDSISPPIKCIKAQKKNYGNDRIYKPMNQSNTWFTSSEVIELRKIKKDGKWGAQVFKYIYPSINYDRFLYDSILDFGEYCFATAFKNGESGLINEWGETLLDYKYSKIISLGQNYFALQKDNLWGISYLDTIIFQPKYNDYKLIENNWHLKKDDNWGVFSYDGKMLCDFKYNEIQDFENFNGEVKFAKVIDNNKVGLINQNFEEVLAPKYGEVLKIQIDNNTKDLFVFVKEGGLYGSVNLDRSKIDNMYNISTNYNSIEELENQINLIKKRIADARRLAEENRIADARRLAEENRIAEARRIAEEKKVTASNNQTINQNLKNEDCSVIIKEYEAFVNEFSKYCSAVKSGKRIPNMSEYLNWDKKIRFMNDIIYNCSNGNNLNRVMTSMLKLQSSAQIIFRSTPNSNNSNNTISSSSNKKCGKCKPSDSKGWYITDYDDYKKIHTNGRYIKNIGHRPCSSCHGTGNCRAYSRCSQYDKSYICNQCKGDRWEECDRCKGTGESK